MMKTVRIHSNWSPTIIHTHSFWVLEWAYEFAQLFLVFNKYGTSEMKYWPISVCIDVLHFVREFVATCTMHFESFRLGEAPSHTTAKTLKPIISRCSIQCHTMGNITFPDALTTGNCAYGNSKDENSENKPQIINTSIRVASLGLESDVSRHDCSNAVRCSCTSELSTKPINSPLCLLYTKPFISTSSKIRATYFWWSGISISLLSSAVCPHLVVWVWFHCVCIIT